MGTELEEPIVSVDFYLDDFGGKIRDEKAFAVEPPAYREISDSGGLRLFVDGALVMTLEDDLGALMANLCGHDVEVLRETGALTYSFFSFPGKLSLKREGTRIVLSSDHAPTKELPLGLVDALERCRDRYLSLLASLKGLTPAEESSRRAFRDRILHGQVEGGRT